MSKSNQPKLTVEREIGDISVQFQDASLHLFIPEDTDFFEINRNELPNFIADLESLLGKIEKKEKVSRTEGKGFGQYTVDSTLYLSKNYQINFIQDELYVGASGGTDQILIELLSAGFASGIGAELSRRLINLIIKNTQYSSKKFSKEELYKRIKNLLYKHYGAAGEITFKSSQESENQIEMTATDMRGKIFEIVINIKSGVPSILVKN